MLNLSRNRTVQRVTTDRFAEELVLLLNDVRSIDGFGFSVKAGTITGVIYYQRKAACLCK